jgi:hypothetical protein
LPAFYPTIVMVWRVETLNRSSLEQPDQQCAGHESPNMGEPGYSSTHFSPSQEPLEDLNSEVGKVHHPYEDTEEDQNSYPWPIASSTLLPKIQR